MYNTLDDLFYALTDKTKSTTVGDGAIHSGERCFILNKQHGTTLPSEIEITESNIKKIEEDIIRYNKQNTTPLRFKFITFRLWQLNALRQVDYMSMKCIRIPNVVMKAAAAADSTGATCIDCRLGMEPSYSMNASLNGFNGFTITRVPYRTGYSLAIQFYNNTKDSFSELLPLNDGQRLVSVHYSFM